MSESHRVALKHDVIPRRNIGACVQRNEVHVLLAEGAAFDGAVKGRENEHNGDERKRQVSERHHGDHLQRIYLHCASGWFWRLVLQCCTPLRYQLKRALRCPSHWHSRWLSWQIMIVIGTRSS